MRHVLNLLVLVAFATATTLMVGCGETASTDTTPAEESGASNASAPVSIAGDVSKVSFTVTGMT